MQRKLPTIEILDILYEVNVREAKLKAIDTTKDVPDLDLRDFHINYEKDDEQVGILNITTRSLVQIPDEIRAIPCDQKPHLVGLIIPPMGVLDPLGIEEIIKEHFGFKLKPERYEFWKDYKIAYPAKILSLEEVGLIGIVERHDSIQPWNYFKNFGGATPDELKHIGELDKERASIVLGEHSFWIDIDREELREVGNWDARIPFTSLKAEGDHYTLHYDPWTKNAAEESRKQHPDIIVYTIPSLVSLDPEGMAKKYGWTLDEVMGKTDAEVIRGIAGKQQSKIKPSVKRTKRKGL
jgi:vacuolar-type H+-ATPase subunit F/Vma7